MRLTYDFEESVGYHVKRVHQLLEQAVNEELREHGITFRQFQVLAALAALGEASQSAIADWIGMEGATLVGVLDRMERAGWIRRHPCPEDRRKKLIRPTDKVEPVWRTMVECAKRVRQRATAGIDPSDLEHAKDVLRQIRENMELQKMVIDREVSHAR